MKAAYLESSALLSLILGEANARAVERFIEETDVLSTSVLTFTEARRALCRLVTNNKATIAQARESMALLDDWSASWVVVQMSPEILSRAGEFFTVEPVRTLDAIHLATIIDLIKVFPQLTVMSFDHRIEDNLKHLGIAVF